MIAAKIRVCRIIMKFKEKLSEIRGQASPVPTVSRLFLSHAENPKNLGELEAANGMAVGVGSCGDTLAVQLLVVEGVIEDIKCLPNGCLYTVVCASMMSEIAKGLPLDEALKLQPEDVDTLLGGLPSDHLHCARLAVNTLGEAIEDHLCRYGFPDGLIDRMVQE